MALRFPAFFRWRWHVTIAGGAKKRGTAQVNGFPRQVAGYRAAIIAETVGSGVAGVERIKVSWVLPALAAYSQGISTKLVEPRLR